MPHYSLSLSRPRATASMVIAAIAIAIALLLGIRIVTAQVEGERGIAPVVASSDIDVGGIEVDVTGKDAAEAQRKGWVLAQRKAWEKIGGPSLSDGRIQSMVSSIVIEREQAGANRYIARLGVIFDRQRAGSMLGRGGQRARSAPLLLIPVTMSAGEQLVYEQRNPWQRAWAQYQAGGSRIDYVRPAGSGGESLLVTYGQTERRSRLWWRNILDQFEASDVIVAVADLEYQWPGGPVEATFTARYGPDNRYLDSFAMTAANPRALPEVMDDAIAKFETIFEKALADGVLKPDPTLNQQSSQIDPAIARLLQIGRASEQREKAQAAARAAAEKAEAEGTPVIEASPTPAAQPAVVSTYVVQFATPDAGSFDAGLSGVRGAAGVRGVAVSSTAIGGTSVMRVSYGGSLDQLAAALRARGFNVSQGSNALAISR